MLDRKDERNIGARSWKALLTTAGASVSERNVDPMRGFEQMNDNTLITVLRMYCRRERMNSESPDRRQLQKSSCGVMVV